MSPSDAGVAEIIRLMLADEWKPGDSHAAICAKYGIRKSTALEWAGEAGRFIRLCVGSEDEIDAALLAGIRRCYEAVTTGQRKEWRTALAALELKAKVLRRIGGHGKAEDKVNEESAQVDAERLAEVLRAHGYEVKRGATADGDEGTQDESTNEGRGGGED